MPYENRGEVVLTSKTQSPDQLRAVAESLGYEAGAVEEITDQPAEELPSGTIPAETQTEDPSTPAAEVQPPAAADASETAADLEPAEIVQEQTPAPPERQSRHKRQIQKRDAEIQRLKTENEARDRELAEFRTKAGTPAPRSEPAATVVETKPVTVAEAEPRPVYDEAKYPSYEDFIADIGQWGYREAQRKDQETKRVASEQTEAEKRRTAETEARTLAETNRQTQEQRWQASLADARKRVPDFDQVMNVQRNVTVPPLVVTAIQDRENGAQLAHYLVSHPEEEKAIFGKAKLPEKPTDAQFRRAYAQLDRELDRIASSLPAVDDTDPDEPEPEETPAPAPKAQVAPPTPRTPATPKPTPPPSVGQRTNVSPRSLSVLATQSDSNIKALRELGGENYRKMRESKG